MIERAPHHMRMPAHPAAPLQNRPAAHRARQAVHPVAQMHRARRPSPRVTAAARVTLPTLSGYDPLGFSLKPPKAVRKAAKAIKKAVTIKNVAKVAAVVGAAALIPGALPMVAKGALAVGKGVVGGAKILGRGAVAAERAIVGTVSRNVGAAVGVFKPQPGGDKNNPAPSQPTDEGLPWVATTAPTSAPVGQPAPPPVSQGAPDIFDASGQPVTTGTTAGAAGAATPDDSPAATAPTQAGFGAVAPLAIAGVAAVLLLARKPRRSRR